MRYATIVFLFFLLPWHAYGQCRRGKCGGPQVGVPPAFLFGWERTVCVCTPSRTVLFDRMRKMIQKEGRYPTAILDLYTSDERFHLSRSMLHGSDRPKAFLTWMIVSKGAPLPNMVRRKLPIQKAYVIEQQLQVYRNQIEQRRQQQETVLQLMIQKSEYSSAVPGR